MLFSRVVMLFIGGTMLRRTLAGAAIGAVVLSSAAHADLVIDRGLPTENLNGTGSNRSNVTWAVGYPDNLSFAFGDSFSLGGVGGTIYTITDLRTWTITPVSQSGTSSPPLSATLYTAIGAPSATSDGGGIFLDASSVQPTFTPVTYADGSNYVGYGGGRYQLYQVDFTGLDLDVAAGSTVTFGVNGSVAPNVDGSQNVYFNHASNAALSGSPQDGSNNTMWEIYTGVDGGTPYGYAYDGAYDSNGNGWDKSSDINVQVFAAVPEPATLTVLAVGLATLGIRRRRKQAG